MSEPLLRMEGITKSFFGVRVLDGVDFDCRAGEVHALVGENGAGKSTLMKILAGAYQADAGRVLLDGREVRFGHPREAQAWGISIIYQEFNLLPDRTVAQNIFLGREPRRGLVVDQGAMAAATAELLAPLRVEGAVRPDSLVRDLSVAQQQMVEIAKALSFDARIIVMDEPTAALPPHEVAALRGRIRLLQERGLAIVYVSHRLQEVFDLSQRITVLKDGRRVDTVETGAVGPQDLVRMMVGRELSHYFPPRGRPEDRGDVVLRVQGAGNDRLHDIGFELRAGEIVGVAGLEGSGATPLAHALFGSRPFTRGAVELAGRPLLLRSPRQAIRSGVGFLTEDRKTEGLVLPLTVRENALLAWRSLDAQARRLAGQAASASGLARRVGLDAPLEREVQYLSGGNQQKVVLAKWLATGSRLLIFDEPTRGIDVGAKAGIHELMRELARQGAAILMISSELPEVIGMSDRILVMRAGAIAGELPAGASEPTIMLVATGQAGAA
jgi:ABC-type sugar transport system ATPase subunit